MTAKEYLKQYEYMVRRVRRLEEEYEVERLQIDAVRSVSDNDGMPHGSGISKPTEDKAIRLSDKLQRLADARIEAVRIRQDIFDMVESVDGVEGEVLYERYINLKPWDEVCKAVCYGWAQTHRYHRHGLEIVSNRLGIE